MRPSIAPSIVAALLLVNCPSAAFAQTVPAEREAPVVAHPTAADIRQARWLSELGSREYSRHHWSEALDQFRASWLLVPRPSVQAAMANCYVALHRPVEAIHHLEDYLRESPHMRPARRVILEGRIRALQGTVAEVTISVDPPGPATDPAAVVTLDDHAITPGHPLRVLPGHHVVEVHAPGYQPAVREFVAAHRDVLTISVALTLINAPIAVAPVAPQAVAPAPPPPPVATALSPTPQEPAQPEFAAAEPDVIAPLSPVQAPIDLPRHGLLPNAFYAVTGATGVSALGWGLCALLAQLATNDFDTVASAVARGSATAAMRAQGTDDYYRARQFSLWSDIGLGGSLVGVAVAAILYFRTDFHAANPTTASIAPTAEGLRVRF